MKMIAMSAAAAIVLASAPGFCSTNARFEQAAGAKPEPR